ncbi:MAG: sulfatase-like hydrolase/transferase [Treponema sp.]|nr:sulfatase-like hydrolase/transferase [Treponema sp.]
MERRNILIILTDQLAWRALDIYGAQYGSTPAINSICRGAAVFDSCYTPCPLCQPARASFWTGIYPHETNVLSNGMKWPVEPVSESIKTIGEVFRNAGYRTVHFGKKHDAGSLRGFDCAEEDQLPVEDPDWPLNNDTFKDRYTAEEIVKFWGGLKYGHDNDNPVFMIADFVNPHNICGYVGNYAGAHENPAVINLPELPPNFEFSDINNRPLPVQYICCSHNRQAQAAEWTPENYRHYLAAYYRYINYADSEIKKVLDALEKSGRAKDTLIIFTSDHGDSMASRRRVTKDVDFYDEVTRVPLVFKGPGVKDLYIKGKPVSLLDLFPTLCGYCGLAIPAELRGKDLSNTIRGSGLPAREYVVSQWHTEWGYTVEPGRMLVTDRYKYIKYACAKDDSKAEEFYDLGSDPWEITNQVSNPEYAQALENCRAMFRSYLEETGDNFENLEFCADPMWHSHKPGYENHEGPAAPAWSWEKYGRPGQDGKR